MLQAVGETRLVDGAEIERATPARLDQGRQLADVAVAPGIGEVGDFRAFRHVDVEQRAAIFVGSRHQDEPVLADLQGFERAAFQYRRAIGMHIGDGKIALARAKVIDAFKEVGGMHAGAKRQARDQRRADPFREEIHRQRMQRSKRQHGRALAGDIATIGAQPVGLAHEALAARQEHRAGPRQLHGIGAAVDEIGADPVLKRFDAPTKGGLGNVACSRRRREIPCRGNFQKIFKPLQFHAGPHACFA
ncbi:hypothetical protein D9M68_715890 [compost metagenome]